MRKSAARILALALAAACVSPAAKKPKQPVLSPLDAWVAEANARASAADQRPLGSIWQPGGVLTDMARDMRASQIDDLLTIVVEESASAVSKGSTKTARQSSAKYTASSIAGITRATGPLANMLTASGDQSLAGEGTTVRSNSLSTTLSARVAGVLPNGYLVVEGTKNIMVNSEVQLVTVRGVVRPADIGSGNTIASNRLAQLEVKINGKGVVGDAIRRPNILYRILLGLLPF
jgi:flagellar L-ring protein precursor FlgH